MLSNIETSSTLPIGQEVRGIQGKRILIVGDCELSRATAALLAGHGARVFFTAPNAEVLGELLGDVAHARGEGEGMIASRESAEEMRRFFDRAKRQLEQIDVLIYQPSAAELLPDGAAELVEAALQHMQQTGCGHIIVINSSSGGLTADLRRKAVNSGIRMTRIEPAAGVYRLTSGSTASDVASCVYEIIARPFAGDVIFMRDPFQEKIGEQMQ